MTPYQLARDLCCNFDPSSNCTGGGFKSLPADPIHTYDLPTMDKPCVLTKLDQRCEFFERCVLPACDDARGATDRQHASRLDARRQYLDKFPLKRFASTSRTCECGKSIGKRARFCESCKARKRSESARRSRDRKKRSGAQQLTAKVPS